MYGERSDRRTICVSTQVGCAYGCKFCASGLDGWTRNLDAAEIVQQLLAVEKASGERIDNVVFMGMGEPLANFANVVRAIRIINAPWGMEIGARHITVSTSGLAPQIRQLADEPLQSRLAISLHGATDEVRNRIMPVNRKYDLKALLSACDYYASRKKQRIYFEYILIAGRERRRRTGASAGGACAAVRRQSEFDSLQHGRRPGMVAPIAPTAGTIPLHPARTRDRGDIAPRKRPRHRSRLRTIAVADQAIRTSNNDCDLTRVCATQIVVYWPNGARVGRA